ncbi:hypothetical protein CBS9595_001698 [Malassezia furfur]|nr:hypothetical protein CBS9595_001698 [Malassezia furfur]
MPESTQRLVVVSNRLPVTIKKDASAPGGFAFSKSPGGLVSALRGTKKTMDFTWIGWPGISVPPSSFPFIEKTLSEEYNCKPVWLPEELAERHYNGFSNSILWPLFHYHPGEMNFDEANWIAYREANRRFAATVRQILRPGDRVWVQDYHLMLLPLMLSGLLEDSDIDVMVPGDCAKLGLTSDLYTDIVSESMMFLDAPSGGSASLRRKDIHIGFFLHTPFPSSEVYRILPVRREILLGILHCDLIGFHTYDYVRHFLSSCSRILGLPTFPNGADFCGRRVQVRTYPIGIEPQQFEEALLREPVQNRISALKRRFEGVKIIVGIDRLDYIKGLPQKLQGLETFFEDHPEWIGRAVLVQIAVPSRQDVEEYQNLRATVNEMVGRINGRFGTVESLPIHLLYRSVNFDELCALYAVSDVCLVTSTRDGMNLVSYEYVACQQGRNGVMILSEFAGAAQSLNGSLIVNPWDRFAVADAIHTALTMDSETREKNAEKLLRYVKRHTASWWGRSFVEDLGRTRCEGMGMAIEHV